MREFGEAAAAWLLGSCCCSWHPGLLLGLTTDGTQRQEEGERASSTSAGVLCSPCVEGGACMQSAATTCINSALRLRRPHIPGKALAMEDTSHALSCCCKLRVCCPIKPCACVSWRPTSSSSSTSRM
jgi:hypothetical protein